MEKCQTPSNKQVCAYIVKCFIVRTKYLFTNLVCQTGLSSGNEKKPDVNLYYIREHEG